VDQLDKEPNKSHDEKTNANGSPNGSELFAVRLCALLDQVHRILGKLSEGLNEHLVEALLFRHGRILFNHCHVHKRREVDNKQSETYGERAHKTLTVSQVVTPKKTSDRESKLPLLGRPTRN
jgi:hypothetical protein